MPQSVSFDPADRYSVTDLARALDVSPFALVQHALRLGYSLNVTTNLAAIEFVTVLAMFNGFEVSKHPNFASFRLAVICRQLDTLKFGI